MNNVEINKSMRLSEHFSLGEVCKTSHKTKDGNIPSRVAIENLKNICENWLEDLRYINNLLYEEVGSDRGQVLVRDKRQSRAPVSHQRLSVSDRNLSPVRNKILEVLLKPIHIRPKRHHPVRIKCLLNVFLL